MEMPMALMSVNGSGRNDRYIVEQNKSYNRFKLNCNVQLKTISHIWKVYGIFIFHPILMQSFSLNWLGWELLVACQQICSMYLNPIRVIDIIDNGAVIGTKFNTCSNNSYKQEMPMALMSVNGSGRNDHFQTSFTGT
jgi:hypothetical protein